MGYSAAGGCFFFLRLLLKEPRRCFLDCVPGIEAAALKQPSLKDHHIPEEF